MIEDDLTENTLSLGNMLDTPRHALSLFLTIDLQKNRIIDKTFESTLVYNHALSYDEAREILDKTSTSKNKLSCYKSELTCLFNYYEKNSASSKSNKSTLHDTDIPVSTEKMIEFYMLLYNKTVAEYLYNKTKHTILRTHKQSYTNLDSNSISNTDDLSLNRFLNLKSLNSAIYESNPQTAAHQGLKSDLYTHATSPIRRFVDIINQINILQAITGAKKFILLNSNNLQQINQFDKI